jgi:membrane-bound lytic murein transglycosylase F
MLEACVRQHVRNCDSRRARPGRVGYYQVRWGRSLEVVTRVRAVSTISLCGLLATCQVPPTLLDRIVDAGELRVVTRNGPTTYYLGPDGPVGPEYDLVQGFADHLGVELRIYTPDSFQDIVPEVAAGRAHIAAASLTSSDAAGEPVMFGPAYGTVTEQLVYRINTGRPRSLEDIYGAEVAVMAGSSHARTLAALRDEHEALSWREVENVDEEELLARVSAGELAYTVADSQSVRLSRYFHPHIRPALDLSEPEPIAWALRDDGRDRSLLRAAEEYFEEVRDTELLAAIEERYYGHAKEFDYVGARTFLKHIDRRLPRYREWFQDAAAESEVDWRLVAALAYQESHWNPDAVSPTGVRGLMMLTQVTAESLGVDDREDAEQSIYGGAEYFRFVSDRVPSRVPEPDRVWMAVAAYNVGWGHVADARTIARRRGLDPDSWQDVRECLPLLTQKKWYSQVPHGYARGWQPVNYVDNVRSYYEVLLWMTADWPQEPVQADNEPLARDRT